MVDEPVQTPAACVALCQQLEPHLANETRRCSALPVRVRVNSRLGSSWPPVIEEARLSADRRFFSGQYARPLISDLDVQNADMRIHRNKRFVAQLHM